LNASRRQSACSSQAQEIVVDNASYPTKEIAENSHIYRTLGLGYANLGSLIMSYGLPYDSMKAVRWRGRSPRS
jgi:ribonucleoside-diphosphate reductase alpha chain